MQQVHVRINDAASGKPTPVRLRITDADGVYYAPYGRLTEFATGVNQDVGGNVEIGANKWAYIDGTCEIVLPPGKLHVEIAKGFEYKPIDEEITLLAGKMSLRFTIERWCDMRKEGWYSGDGRAHFLTPDAALLEGQAEDLAVVNLLAQEITTERPGGRSNRSIPNIISFSGQQFARTTENCGVAVGTFNDNLSLLHSHRVVYPLTMASGVDWTAADWCAQCHRKRGLVAWLPYLSPRTKDLFFTEELACVVLGMIDAYSVNDELRRNLKNQPFYSLANAELVLPFLGESGKSRNTCALGEMRTFVHLPQLEEISYSAWIEAVRAGHTFVSNGPLLNFTVNDMVQPAQIEIKRGSSIMRIRVEAKSPNQFDRLELIWNGNVVAAASPPGTWPHQTVLEHEFAATESGWLAARCITGTAKPAPLAPFAHTSIVVIRVEDAPHWAKSEDVKFVLSELDRMLAQAQMAPQRPRLVPIIEEARTVLAKKLS